MKISVLSGKGGTGKTTIAVGIANTIEGSIKTDCDVDAANMHLFYKGEQINSEEFYSGEKAYIDIDKCIKCGICEENCKFNAIKNNKIDLLKCEGCGVCSLVCKSNAIILSKNKVANIFEYKLEDGYLIKADMEIGADGSGRLITKLRENTKKYGDINIIDGSPGIGCSVIASVTGIDIALIVTEPTLSGLDDLKRILELTKTFNVLSLVCINKYDINLDMSQKIEKYCIENNIQVISKIPYDNFVLKSINELKPITLYKDSEAGKKVKEISEKILGIYQDIKTKK
ncbi:MAG TPA: ATP-binding protein [Clostridia bacterium]|nr:ATP-binding protein [Clostridia bacterium]